MPVRLIECHYAHCDQCGEGFGEDDMVIHYDDRAKLLQALVRSDWIVLDERVLCSECASATSCELMGHRLEEKWWPFETATYSGRIRDCECCNYREYDPPREAATDRRGT